MPYTGLHFETLNYQAIVPKSDKIFLLWQSTLPYETYKGRWRGGYTTTCYGYYPPNLPATAFSSKSISSPAGRIRLTITPIDLFSPFKEPTVEGIVSSPLLITPVRQKRYDMYGSMIEGLWKKFNDSLSTADRIVVVGYSFPPTDTRPLELLRNALNSRGGCISFEIVDPNANDISSRIGNDYLSKAKSIKTHCLTFEKYLGNLFGDAPKMMKKAARKYKEVNDWLRRIHALFQIGTRQR